MKKFLAQKTFDILSKLYEKIDVLNETIPNLLDDYYETGVYDIKAEKIASFKLTICNYLVDVLEYIAITSM